MTTSDFPKLLSNLANKNLQDSYMIAPQTFRPLVKEKSLPNFKKHLAVRIGDTPELKLKREGGEYERAAIGEEGETYQLATFGRIVALTREAIINDDLGGFTEALNNFGVSANIRESDLFYNSFLINQRMSDNNRYFSKAHGNLLEPKKSTAKPPLSSLTVQNISDARQMLQMQKTIDGRFMNLQMKYLIVPPNMQTKAEQLMFNGMIIQSVDDVNVFSDLKIISDPRLEVEPDNWYVACVNSYCNLFNIAYLDGHRGPYIDSQEDFETDTTEYKCRLDCAVAPIDWRGIVKIETK
jgi:phage major head subunit gpT-like protein